MYILHFANTSYVAGLSDRSINWAGQYFLNPISRLRIFLRHPVGVFFLRHISLLRALMFCLSSDSSHISPGTVGTLRRLSSDQAEKQIPLMLRLGETGLSYRDGETLDTWGALTQQDQGTVMVLIVLAVTWENVARGNFTVTCCHCKTS